MNTTNDKKCVTKTIKLYSNWHKDTKMFLIELQLSSGSTFFCGIEDAVIQLEIFGLTPQECLNAICIAQDKGEALVNYQD